MTLSYTVRTGTSQRRLRQAPYNQPKIRTIPAQFCATIMYWAVVILMLCEQCTLQCAIKVQARYSIALSTPNISLCMLSGD